LLEATLSFQRQSAGFGLAQLRTCGQQVFEFGAAQRFAWQSADAFSMPHVVGMTCRLLGDEHGTCMTARRAASASFPANAARSARESPNIHALPSSATSGSPVRKVAA